MNHIVCECDRPSASCPRYGWMKGRKFQVCQSADCERRDKLLSAYAKEPYVAREQPKRERAVPQRIYGPGTELRVLLASFGARMGNCNCEPRAAEMDAWGVEGCRKNRASIVAWLQEAASTQSWLQWGRVALLAGAQGFLTVESIVDEAIRRADVARQPVLWAYGVTTVPSRRGTLLPRTLASLRAAGFDNPQLFVDGDVDGKSWKQEFGLQVTCREPPARTYGNWVLAMLELYAKNGNAKRFALFQDDLVMSKNVKRYLERSPYPAGGYCNLYTFPQEQKRAPQKTGFFETAQQGLGALALVFDQDALKALFTHPDSVAHLFDRPHDEKRGWKAADGGVVCAINKAGVREHCHNPSLVQHTGVTTSTVGNAVHPIAVSFRGEDFDALELL